MQNPIEYLDALTIPDDAYLSLTIAKNISQGLGPLYSSNFTNGFQPLYVFLMIPVYILFPNELITPIYFSFLISILFDTMSLFIILKIILLFSKYLFTLVAAAASWIVNPYIIKTTLNGLETTMSFFLIALTFYFCIKNNVWNTTELSKGKAIVLGIFLGLAVLARIDNLLLVAAIFFFLFIKMVLYEQNFLKNLKFVSISAASLLVIILPWLIYSYYYTGDIYPISGKAVRFISLSYVNHNPTIENWYLPMLQKAIMNISRNNVSFILTIFILVIVIFIKRNNLSKRQVIKDLKPFNPVLLFSMFLVLAYAFYIFTYWFFDRYFFPLVLLFILCFSVILDFTMSLFKNNRSKYLFFLLVLSVLLFTNFLRTGFKDLYLQRELGNSGYMKMALWAMTNFADGTIVGSTQTGALGYFAENLKIINLDGVVNEECYREMEKKNLFGYIKETDIKYVIGWQNNIEFIERESTDIKPGNLIFVKKIENIRTLGYDWFLFEVNK